MATINERVAYGAAVLDQKSPGWESQIDLSKLDLNDSCRCVLGQIYGHYFDGLMVLDKGSGGSMGFNIYASESPNRFADLDEAWISLIKERFDTGALSDVESVIDLWS
jgi:hypothetical protein